MQVWDTSAFITAWRVHYRPSTFATFWERIAVQMAMGTVLGPREVYNELRAKDDDVARWAHEHAEYFPDPPATVQRAVGMIQRDHFDALTVRDRADPWVVAEAQVRGFTVVTYEGVNTLSGEPTRKFADKLPGICRRLGIACCIVPEALEQLGVAM